MAAAKEEKVSVELAQLGGAKEACEVDLYWTVNELMDRISIKLEIAKQGMKLLCKGKMLNNDKIQTKTLKSLKIKKNDKIIVMNKPVIRKAKTKGTAKANVNVNANASHSVDNAIQKRKNIDEIKAAAQKLAQRHNDGYDFNSNYYIELTNQYGEAIVLPEAQRQALTVGMCLHEKGKKLMKTKQYSDAIEILKLGFESLSKVEKEFIAHVDNYGLLALDIVWCFYLNKDESNLQSAAHYLDIAQNGLQSAHGKDMERLKQIRGCNIPELALYVRLNILRALSSFYSNDLNNARSHLLSAEMDMRRLQINDLDLVKLESMGFTHLEARRGLRFSSGDIEEAINYIYNKRGEKEKKEREEKKRLQQRAIQKKYGHTQNGEFIDLTLLNQLKQMGVAQEIAVEALRQCNNNSQQTLNLCLDPQKKEILAQTLFARHLNDDCLYKIEQIISILGAQHVTESRVRAALFLSYNDVADAIRILSAPDPNEVIDLDRIEPRFVPYVQHRLTMLMMRTDQNDNDDNGDNGNEDDLKEADNGNEDVVEPMHIETEAMPNPTLGDNDNDNDDADHEMTQSEFVSNYAPIEHKAPNDDDVKIEEHIVNVLDNDDDSYLDVDLCNEQDAINNLKVLLHSMQTSVNPQSCVSLFPQ